jgi:hypothetical protein
MNVHPNRPVARLMWIGPLLLLALGAWLVRAAVEQRAAAEGGEVVTATVDSVSVRERSEITRGAAYLRYTPPGEAAPVVRAVELPLTFLRDLEGRVGEPVRIRLLAGSDQVVLAEHARAQWVMTSAFAAMALFGALGLGWMVGAWNRLLAREGDPALRVPGGRAQAGR